MVLGIRCDVDIFKLTASAQPINKEVYAPTYRLYTNILVIHHNIGYTPTLHQHISYTQTYCIAIRIHMQCHTSSQMMFRQCMLLTPIYRITMPYTVHMKY